MTLEECTAILAPMFVAIRVPMDVPGFRLYHRALQDVPIGLLEQAAADVAKVTTSQAYPPKPGDLRRYAELARQRLLQAHPFQRCVNCSAQGWTETEVDGVRRVVRCSCWLAWQARLEQLGATPRALLQEPAPALPAGE